jgi:[NiFe] hydrogenase assembly HybE family chaperone
MIERASRPAQPRADDPSGLVAQHFRQAWQERRHGLPAVNPALVVESIGFVRHEGDWLGVVVAPWFFRLVLVSGGGSLWGDIPAGQRRYLDLPGGTLPFVAVDEPGFGPYQYSPLVEPVTALADMATARRLAAEAMAGLRLPVPPMRPDSVRATAPAATPPGGVTRRGFLRRLAVGR